MLGDTLESTSGAPVVHAGEGEDIRPYFCGEVRSRHVFRGSENVMRVGCHFCNALHTATFPRSLTSSALILSTRRAAPTCPILRTILSPDKWLWKTTVPQSKCPQMPSSQNTIAGRHPSRKTQRATSSINGCFLAHLLKPTRLLEKDGIVKRCSSRQSVQSASILESSRPALPRVSVKSTIH